MRLCQREGPQSHHRRNGELSPQQGRLAQPPTEKGQSQDSYPAGPLARLEPDLRPLDVSSKRYATMSTCPCIRDRGQGLEAPTTMSISHT